jgi:hypothetical protein
LILAPLQHGLYTIFLFYTRDNVFARSWNQKTHHSMDTHTTVHHSMIALCRNLQMYTGNQSKHNCRDNSYTLLKSNTYKPFTSSMDSLSRGGTAEDRPQFSLVRRRRRLALAISIGKSIRLLFPVQFRPCSSQRPTLQQA